MPDIWTEHPEIVRDPLREAGVTCGPEPRILKGRDPEWTCIINGNDIAGDIYILLVLGEAWMIMRLKRTRDVGHAQSER